MTMKLRSLTLLAVALAAQTVHAAPTSPAPVPIRPGGVTKPGIHVKRAATLTVDNVSGMPGEVKHFKVSLRFNGAPAVGKTVVIHVEGKDDASHESLKPGQRMEIGSATIGADGAGAHVFQLAAIAQGNYAIKASFAGDDDTLPAEGAGNLLVVKAPTKMEMAFNYGSYKNEPGKFASLAINVKRSTDGAVVGVPIQLTVNGESRTLPAADFQNVPLTGAGPWSVTAQFAGTSAYAATSASGTYKKP